MNDLADMARLEATIDILRAENTELRRQNDDLRRAPTWPAPPCSDSLPSPRDALPTIEWDSSSTDNLLPEAS